MPNILICSFLLFLVGRSRAFVPPATPTVWRSSRLCDSLQLADGIQKRVIATAPDQGDTAAAPKAGDRVVIDYVGRIAERHWSAQEVVSCWLGAQQGVEDLAQGFLSNEIDEQKLTSITEEFIRDELGVENKIKCKKIIMAIKRLQATKDEYAVGSEFDSSIERGEPYSFVLGSGKAIQAMDQGVASMKVGEKAEIMCRSDTAYGSEGLRKANGDVMVPPFASLSFEVELLRIEEAS